MDLRMMHPALTTIMSPYANLTSPLGDPRQIQLQILQAMLQGMMGMPMMGGAGPFMNVSPFMSPELMWGAERALGSRFPQTGALRPMGNFGEPADYLSGRSLAANKNLSTYLGQMDKRLASELSGPLDAGKRADLDRLTFGLRKLADQEIQGLKDRRAALHQNIRENTVNVEPPAFGSVKDASKLLSEKAAALGQPVSTQWNDSVLVARPGDSPSTVFERWEGEEKLISQSGAMKAAEMALKFEDRVKDENNRVHLEGVAKQKPRSHAEVLRAGKAAAKEKGTNWKLETMSMLEHPKEIEAFARNMAPQFDAGGDPRKGLFAMLNLVHGESARAPGAQKLWDQAIVGLLNEKKGGAK